MIASVALRVKMTSWLSGALMKRAVSGAGPLVLGRRLLADRVDAAMDVGVVLAVVVGDGIDDDARLLAGRRRVEVDEAVAVHLLVEDREILAHGDRIERRRGRGSRGVGAARRAGVAVSVVAWSGVSIAIVLGPRLAGSLHWFEFELRTLRNEQRLVGNVR